MAELLPGILARSRRGLCPTCGAALDLREAGGRLVTCGFCGGQSSLERRLRRVDGDLELPALGAGEGREEDTRALAEALGESRPEAVKCPGCGDLIGGDLAHEILTCGSCGTQSKVERRMVRPRAEARALPQRRTRAEAVAQQRGESDLKWDVCTEQLCWRILNETDPERRVAFALKFEEWCYINATAVYFLPHLMKVAKESDLLLAGPLCDCVGKLLCQEDARLFAPTLEACEPFALDPRGSVEVLHAIGLGNARGMKLLLDAADAASRAGALDYAANALWAAHYIIERNFEEHPVVAEIMLYRLFYLSPVAMGYVLYEMKGGYGGYVFKDPYTLLAFIDDCALERPELVSFLATRPYVPDATTLPELEERLAFTRGRLTKAGQSAALRALTNVAPEAPKEVLEAAVAFAEPWLDDPELAEAATVQFRKYIGDGEGLRPPLEALVRRRGHALPEILQREVHWKVPGTPLLDRSKIPPYYDGDPEVRFAPAVEEALAAYDAAIRAAVDSRGEERDRARELWERLRGVDVPLFDEPDRSPGRITLEDPCG